MCKEVFKSACVCVCDLLLLLLFPPQLYSLQKASLVQRLHFRCHCKQQTPPTQTHLLLRLHQQCVCVYYYQDYSVCVYQCVTVAPRVRAQCCYGEWTKQELTVPSASSLQPGAASHFHECPHLSSPTTHTHGEEHTQKHNIINMTSIIS